MTRFIADAQLLKAGSIIQIENPLGTTGRATHAHFFVVVSRPAILQVGDTIFTVGVSSTILRDSFDHRFHIPMKWLARKGGDPETGFDRPCYAIFDFIHILTVVKGSAFPPQVAAQHAGRFVRSDKAAAIAAAFAARKRQNDHA